MRRGLRRAVVGSVVAIWLVTGAVVGPVKAIDPLTVEQPRVAPARETEPVVLSGALFAGWAAPADVTAKVPSVAGAQCTSGDNSCTHNQYEKPDVTTGNTLGAGVAVDHLLGYRWNGKRFVQIPFQVDEMAQRYISNNASTFSIYSQTDGQLSYVWDEERFRWTASDPSDPCRAVPAGGVRTTPDPVPGLDTNDELSFMASDAGRAAPRSARLPRGIVGMKRVTIVDPYRPGNRRYVYVMQAGTGPDAPAPAFTAANGYVRYHPDADSDTFLFSQSRYSDYGNAAKGPYFDPATGACITAKNRYKQRRPKDSATITTPRYSFRYDGRWLLDEVKVATSRPWEYGPDLVDRFKARAYQQRPGGSTPCCGYEEEQNNWGGSSILLGVRAGPVRVIRATWGADSSTNTVRTETFYRDEFHLGANLRVHPITPLDGIYAQWDFNAGKVTRYFNNAKPGGAFIDGQNDEVFGNTRPHVGSDGVRIEDRDEIPVVGAQTITAGSPADGKCPNKACVDNDIDVPDPFLSGVSPALNYDEVTGPNGTMVFRTTIRQHSAGDGYSLVAVPYYRDDSCFDDGTGSDPGLHVNGPRPDPAVDSKGRPRVCWRPEDGDPAAYPPDHFFQGDIGTFGFHIETIVDSDNAFTTLPVTEIDSDQRVVLLRGERGNVGERYGRGLEKPLIATVG